MKYANGFISAIVGCKGQTAFWQQTTAHYSSKQALVDTLDQRVRVNPLKAFYPIILLLDHNISVIADA